MPSSPVVCGSLPEHTSDMTPVDTSKADAAKTSSLSSSSSPTPTLAASPTQKDIIKPDDNHEDYTFYMDSSPRQDSKTAQNSELAGDDDDDDDDKEDEEVATAAVSPHKTNSSSSLATVAENAMEKLVGIAMMVPDALITADDDKDDNSHHHYRDSHHPLEHAESEVYLEDSELETGGHATTVRQQEQPAQLTNQTNTTLSAESTTTTTKDESADIPASPATSSSASSIISTDSTSSSDTQTIGASKDILTEGQAFAYVGLCLVTSNTLFQALEGTETAHAKQSLESFVSKLINRLYKHLDIDANSKFFTFSLWFIVIACNIFKERLFFANLFPFSLVRDGWDPWILPFRPLLPT